MISTLFIGISTILHISSICKILSYWLRVLSKIQFIFNLLWILWLFYRQYLKIYLKRCLLLNDFYILLNGIVDFLQIISYYGYYFHLSNII